MIKKAQRFFVCLTSLCIVMPTFASEPKTYCIAWSHHTGWEPWEYARSIGILDKWADKYGIKIKLDLINDYAESIELYAAGAYHGCVMTNMDALHLSAVAKVDSTVLIIGDFSNGNDGIVIKNGDDIYDLKGRGVKLEKFTRSHYLLTRALALNDIKEEDITLINTKEADMTNAFAGDQNGAVVTWNPHLIRYCNLKNAELIFDSSEIPGEIINMMVVHSDSPDSLKKALAGAWYETMAAILEKDEGGKKAIEYMANSAGETIDEFIDHLRTTAMFLKPEQAVAFASGSELKKTMEYMRDFSIRHGLLGNSQKKSIVGIDFPDGSVLGSRSNIRLHFDATYMKMAAEGAL